MLRVLQLEKLANIPFSLSELLLIESILAPSEITALGNKDVSEIDNGIIPCDIPSNEMCLKIGSAILEGSDRLEKEKLENIKIEVSFLERELWILRERININQAKGPDIEIGFRIKKRIYKAILDVENQKEMGDIVLAEESNTMTAQEVKNVLSKQQNENKTEGDTNNQTEPKSRSSTRKKV